MSALPSQRANITSGNSGVHCFFFCCCFFSYLIHLGFFQKVSCCFAGAVNYLSKQSSEQQHPTGGCTQGHHGAAGGHAPASPMKSSACYLHVTDKWKEANRRMTSLPPFRGASQRASGSSRKHAQFSAISEVSWLLSCTRLSSRYESSSLRL